MTTKPGKMTELILMPFNMWTRVGQRYHVLHTSGSWFPHMTRQLWGLKGPLRTCWDMPSTWCTQTDFVALLWMPTGLY